MWKVANLSLSLSLFASSLCLILVNWRDRIRSKLDNLSLTHPLILSHSLNYSLSLTVALTHPPSLSHRTMPILLVNFVKRIYEFLMCISLGMYRAHSLKNHINEAMRKRQLIVRHIQTANWIQVRRLIKEYVEWQWNFGRRINMQVKLPWEGRAKESLNQRSPSRPPSLSLSPSLSLPLSLFLSLSLSLFLSLSLSLSLSMSFSLARIVCSCFLKVMRGKFSIHGQWCTSRNESLERTEEWMKREGAKHKPIHKANQTGY